MINYKLGFNSTICMLKPCFLHTTLEILMNNLGLYSVKDARRGLVRYGRPLRAPRALQLAAACN